MRAFKVPVQITDEEKLFGGILSLRQFLYIFTGFALGGLFFTLSFMPVLVRLFLFLTIFIAGIGMALIPIKDMRADQYIYYLIKWKRSPKEIYYIRSECQ